MSAQLTATIAETVLDHGPAPDRGKSFEEHRPQKRLRIERGSLFRPHGTDSTGRIISDPERNRRSVQFIYEHDRGTVYSMPQHEFNGRFARLLSTPRKTTATVRNVKPMPKSIINARKGK